MPARHLARTITQIPISQGAAGSTDLVDAPGSDMRIYVVSFALVLSAAGSFKFAEGTGPTDLTGVMPFSINGGLVAVGSGDDEPILQTNTKNSKLAIITVTGKAFGWLRYFLDL